MDAPTLKRAASAVTVGVGGLLWLAAILFMAQTAQNSEQFSRLHPWILMINIAGLAVLVGLLATKLAQLIRDWRGHVIGSRLKARMVWIFGVLATLPILLVYFFAVQFLKQAASTAGSTSRSAAASTTRWCCRARRSRCACASTSPTRSWSRTNWRACAARLCRACSSRCGARSARSN